MFKDIQKKDSNRPLRLGVMRGGQLGRMLMQACMNYDIQGWVMDHDPDCPCAHFCSNFVNGDCRSFDDVYNFGKNVDVLTIELEDINVDALKKLRSEGLRVYPQPEIVELIQDKGKQKVFYRDHGIPTAEFVLLEKREGLAPHSGFLPAVQKLRRSGYDGRGVKMIHSVSDPLFPEPSILERRVNFVKEIAVIAARNERGERVVYPPVELQSDPQNHLLDLLIAPAEIAIESAEQARRITEDLIDKLGLVGLLAVEMFVTADGTVLVNEISPRPHNSGHHTIEANITSQFDQHLRAIMDLPLGRAEARSPAVMVNILGEEGSRGLAVYEGIEKILDVPGVYVHMYGKVMTAPFRKMGHVTVLHENLAKAKETAVWVKKTLRVRA